jgi:hypothetical protein
MKAIKIYLVVVTLLLIIAISLGVYAWYKIQTFRGAVPTDVKSVDVTSNEAIPKDEKGTSAGATPDKEAIVIPTESLSLTQQKMLEAFGFDRLGEIVNGSAPSPLESMKLLPCFKA